MDQYYGNGSVALWWLGQMGLIIKAKKTILCIDYYTSPDEKRQTEPLIWQGKQGPGWLFGDTGTCLPITVRILMNSQIILMLNTGGR